MIDYKEEGENYLISIAISMSCSKFIIVGDERNNIFSPI